MIGMIFTVLLTIIFAEALWQVLLTFWNWITYERKKDMSDKYVTLDEFMNKRGEWVKQVVYKVDGDFNGNIKGDNVTVILMGDGDINGNIDSKKGEIFINKGYELYTQSLSINGYTSEDGAKLTLDVKIDVEEPFRHKCESCRYYRDSDISNKYYWCTEGGMARHCIKDGATICEYYEKK